MGRVFQQLVRGFQSVQAQSGGELTRLAEELLQALERKESWKPAKGEDPPMQAADAFGGISLRMEASVVGAKNIPEKHEQSRTVEQMVGAIVERDLFLSARSSVFLPFFRSSFVPCPLSLPFLLFFLFLFFFFLLSLLLSPRIVPLS